MTQSDVDPNFVSDRVIDQRVRNRIIDYLGLASSFDEQLAYQVAAPHIHVPHEVINQWDDWVSPNWRDQLTAPTFSPAEVDAIGRFYAVWEDVLANTPDPLPALPALLGMPQWRQLASAAAEALIVFNSRGRSSEDREGQAEESV